jgi:hypothetical protein
MYGVCDDGRYQIRQEFVDECNRIIGYDRYTLEDAHDEVKSNRMLVCWHSYWSRKKGTRGDLVAMARQHVGGPNGHLRDCTLDRKRKAIEALRKLNGDRAEAYYETVCAALGSNAPRQFRSEAT